MLKSFIKRFFHSIFELIIKLIGFKSLCWGIATYAYLNNLMTSLEWMIFTSLVIGTKFAKDFKGLYSKITFKKGSEI